MSFKSSTVKRMILASVAAAALTLAVNAGYGLAFLVWPGKSLPDEVLGEIQAGTPYLVLGLFVTAVGAILGARLAEGRNSPWFGPAAGAGLALVVVVVAWLQGRLDFWLPPNAFMAVVGGGLGGWLAGHA